MATYSLANERLRALEDIEREIGAILQNAGSGRGEPATWSESESSRDAAHGRVGCEAHVQQKTGRERRASGQGTTVSLWVTPPLSSPAGTVILELSKEKTNERLLDRQAAAFTASVQHVEAELSAQIRYLTQVSVSGDAAGPSRSRP